MNTSGVDGGFVQKGVEFASDLGGEVGSIGIEFGEGHLLVDRDVGVSEPNGGDILRRQVDLGPFDDLEEGETLVLFDESLEPVKCCGIFGQASETPDEVEFLGVAQKDDLVPLADLAMEGIGHFDLFAPAFIGAAATKERRELVPHGCRVVFVSGDGDTASGEDVAQSIRVALPLRIELHDGEIRGATTEITHQHPLGLINTRFVGEGSGDGLVLKMNFLEAGERCSVVESFLGELIVVGIGRENGGAPHDSSLHILTSHGIGLGLQVAEEERNEFLEKVNFIVYDGLFEGAIGQDALDRLEEAPAHFVLHVTLLGVVADDGRLLRKGVGEIHERRFDVADAWVAHEGAFLHIPDGDG